MEGGVERRELRSRGEGRAHRIDAVQRGAHVSRIQLGHDLERRPLVGTHLGRDPEADVAVDQPVARDVEGRGRADDLPHLGLPRREVRAAPRFVR